MSTRLTHLNVDIVGVGHDDFCRSIGHGRYEAANQIAVIRIGLGHKAGGVVGRAGGE
ncbi:hypothetical protein [Mycobacterium sp.]|uniref:hypothetical protein n=1 Tax=Mycobacterium sp. TaxID=1785 RepID=UPI003D6AC04E